MISFPGYDDVIKNVYDNSQEHVFDHWDSLAEAERKNLLDDLKDVDFSQIKELFASIGDSETAGFGPAGWIRLPETADEKALRDRAREAGIQCIRQGKVAAFVVAGGQGSRLGYDGPKGKFPVGPVSGKSLFQIFGEKIRKYSLKYGVAIPWLVLTSRMNHGETVSYFEEMNFFGLDRADVFIFPQNMIPSLDREGRLVLQDSSSLFRNPDGHGGSLTALQTSGVLGEMLQRGVEIISYFQVDNPLIKIIDPEFIGYHVMNNARISSKALRKSYAGEKVGVFVTFDGGRTGVVEYSDLSEDKIQLKDERGELVYGAGNPAIHLFDTGFIESITSGRNLSLPFHTARKKLSAYRNGVMEEIDGFKFEKFVFDALPLTEHNVIMETIREEEFAPVKNASGVDSLETSRKLMIDLNRKWLAERGITVPGKVSVLEISPLLAVEPGDIPGDIQIPDRESVLLEP